MDAIIGVVAECVKCAIPPCMHQIGYCIHSKKIVEKLARKVEDVKNTRTDVQNRVTAAKKNLESIKKVVEAWLERVEDMVLMNGDEFIDEMIKNQCCKGWWCCCCARYSIGKQAQKKIVSIDDLINEGISFVDVSYPCSLLGLELMPITGDIFSFASRESTRNQVMEALKDEGTYLLGIYGMGGVGKTTLMNQVAKQVKEEKIFDAVVITIVSQNIEVKRIQDEIANKLGLQQLQDVDDKFTRAAMLLERLKQEKRILVILDDLWTADLDLSDVGIPCGEHDHKGCKVLITSRSLEVCNSMLSQKNIKVGVLSKEDSWHLFKKNAGDVVDSHALQTVANEVVKECCGLPIALVTLGRALRNKDKPVWDETSLQLRRSDFTYFEGMKSKVFPSIRLSYDHLGNEILKKCFLFCCLFPEDYPIHIDKLLMYVMSDDMILKNLENLKEVRGTLMMVLDKLIASCLLLLVKKEGNGVISSVRMHDVVRDVAIEIASEEANGFFVKAGLGLKTWPERIGKCLRLSLMENQISVLPDQPELPNLLSLSLEGNHSLKKLPDSFFQSMEALVALDISKTGISSLPTSLSCLVNLRSLHLGKCALHEIDISVIGKLKKLEILNLSGCKLSSLSEEIGGLSNLKLLDLSENCQLYFIPPNVISRVSRLEELYMLASFRGWKVEPTEDGSRANLDEVVSLINFLKSVQLEVYNDEIKARISIGRLFRTDSVFRKWHLREFCDVDHNTFGSYLTAPSPICHSIRVLLGIVDDLKLSKCTGLKSVGQLVIGAGFNNMKSLGVERCNEMEYLMSMVEEKIPTTTFIALEKLYLQGLSNLKEIIHGPMPTGFLDKLDQVYVGYCRNLVSIFSPDVWVKLKNLQGLRVESCIKMKEVFYLKEEEGCRLNKQDGHVDVTFPKLKELYLISLPELTTIWKGVIPIESLQYLKVMEVGLCHGLRYLFGTPSMVLALQQLEELTIYLCEGMAGIVAPPEEMVLKDQVLILPHTSNALPPQIFPNLRLLVIKHCNSLKDLYPLTKLSHGGLSQLLRLEVENCENLEEILLINTDEEEDHDGKAMLPQLENLSLHNLPSLKTIWKGTIPIGSFQKLREVNISKCGDNLKHIFPVSLVLGGGLSELENFQIENCKELKAIIDNHISPTTVDESDQQVLHHQLNWSILLPRLKEMVLKDLPNLTTIAKGVILSFGSYENLEELYVERCNSLKHLLPIRLLINGGLPKLEKIYVSQCNEMEVIFNEDGGDQYNHSKIMEVAFPHLKWLHLFSLPKLSKFHQAPPILDWPSLQYLSVIRCENLKRLPLNHHLIQIPKLEKIVGDSERWFDEELEWEDESLKSSLRPLFMNIEDQEEISKIFDEIEDDVEGSEIDDEEEYLSKKNS